MVHTRYIVLVAAAAMAHAKISAQVHRELQAAGTAQDIVVNFRRVDVASLAFVESTDAVHELVRMLQEQSDQAKRVVDDVLGPRVESSCDQFFYIDNTFFPCGSLTEGEVRKLAAHPNVAATRP
ncbi:hypothetical protein H310_13546 [Aphanomyces invadans]|uniref:Uncharacterized protein n=1 Tax=Aphanomyces invadans TaxID=157072 RepID=A0A024TCY3_9STRA|nr:hypothetical protein H310_13546 [Aphanomyces invadans]ETV92020.1 hypothetical protein H310_13546 [Aphanomyces invadans]|eukprot:XP_008879317.1 hypothetical protein H310_13546 [Aphanomyces invadans]